MTMQMSSLFGLMEGFWVVLGICLLHLVVFLLMIWVSRTWADPSEIKVKEVKEISTHLHGKMR